MVMEPAQVQVAMAVLVALMVRLVLAEHLTKLIIQCRLEGALDNGNRD
jgi:hypothetical protein